jgi:hypothetical protein
MAIGDRSIENIIIYDENGNQLTSFNSPTEDIPISQSASWLDYAFNQSDGTLDTTQFWTSTVVGTGTATQGSGVGTLSTGTTANSTVSLQSPISRLLPATTNAFQADVQTGNTGVANNNRLWGVFDANNGYFFKLAGTTLQFVTRKATVDSTTNITLFTLDTNFHRYKIVYNGMGAVASVDGIVVVTLTMNPAAVLTANDNLPIRLENDNSGGLATNQTLLVRSVGVDGHGILGRRSRFVRLNAAATTVVKRGPGTLRKIMVNNGALAATVTITDNTAAGGTAIGVINAANPGSFIYDLDFNVGLTVVIAGTPDITVVYE